MHFHRQHEKSGIGLSRLVPWFPFPRQIRSGVLPQGILTLARAEGAQRQTEIQNYYGAEAGHKYSTALSGKCWHKFTLGSGCACSFPRILLWTEPYPTGNRNLLSLVWTFVQ